MKLSDHETTLERVLYDGPDIFLKTPSKSPAGKGIVPSMQRHALPNLPRTASPIVLRREATSAPGANSMAPFGRALFRRVASPIDRVAASNGQPILDISPSISASFPSSSMSSAAALSVCAAAFFTPDAKS